MDQDNTFGPPFPGLFDFTLLFEQSILQLLPACLFLVIAPIRISALWIHHGWLKMQKGMIFWAKLLIIGIYIALQVTLLTLWALHSAPKTKTTIAEATVGLVEAFLIFGLSYLEHTCSSKPSKLLSGYLFITCIIELAPARSYWLRDDLHIIAAIYTATLVTKATLIILEELPKKLSSDSKAIDREMSAGIINRSVFGWLNRLFWTGAKSMLSVEDLPDIGDKFTSKPLMDRLEVAWDRSPKEGAFALMGCTFRTYRLQFLAGIFPRLLFSAFTFAQPFLINSVILHVASPSTSNSTAGGLIGATVLVYVGLAVSTAWYKHMTYQMITMYRGGLAALVYKKTLNLRDTKIKDSAPVTLMSTDVEGIAHSSALIHDIWASFIELPIGIYLLYLQVGVPAFFIFIPVLVTTVLGGMIAPGMGPAQEKWNNAIQARIGNTSAMLSQVKGIKIMGLGDFYHFLIKDLRNKEMEASVKMRWLLVYLTSLAVFSQEWIPVVIILSAIFWTKADDGLSIAEAFTSMSIISIASAPLLHILVSTVSLSGVIGTFKRIQDFLKLDELESFKQPQDLPQSEHPSAILPSPNSVELSEGVLLSTVSTKVAGLLRRSELAVHIKNGVFCTSKDEDLLHDINLSIHRNTVNMIVGRIGSGKSSILKAIIRELKLKSGDLQTASPTIAYCDQTPWLENISIRNNITRQSVIDEKRLRNVIHVCGLDEDLRLFEHGDRTIVGSGGVALSGGQKQRVALARAIYSKEHLVLLDDVFSGLDTTTSRAIFTSLLTSDGLLRQEGRTVILVTNQINFLPAADFITMLENGRITRNQVTYDSVAPSEWGVLEENLQLMKSKNLSRSNDLQDNDLTTQLAVPGDRVGGNTPKITTLAELELSRKTGDIECYSIYLRSMGWTVLSALFIFSVISASIGKMPEIWLKLWTEAGTSSRDARYTAGYICFAAVSVIMAVVNIAYFILAGVPKSATHLHNILLKSVVRAPLFFFSSTDSGLTLNRFSQDMTLIDQELPLAFYSTLQLVLAVIAQAGIIASATPYLTAFIPPVLLILYFLQKYYLNTSRQIRFLDLEMKSPLYTQFTETIAGLSTIRAYGWSTSFLDEAQGRLDTSQRPFYLLFCIQRWLEVVLGLLVAGFGLLLVAFALKVHVGHGQAQAAAVGLALLNLIQFNQALTLVIDQWTTLEISLGAISRLKSFVRDTPDENREEETEDPSMAWPSGGKIELGGACASYSPNGPQVLHNISLTVQPGQKVVVCGRSGSGKSSLMLLLLRLLPLSSGTMMIDSTDLTCLPRNVLRKRLTSLPQEPVTMSGTVRYNLDPEGEVQADEVLMSALRKTTIWSVVEGRGGLDAELKSLDLSQGQLQLFCLARCLLSRSQVVLLDEAMSSVDALTEEQVRQVLREEMEGKTVVEVAHRVRGAKGSDLVVVMGEGRILEMGDPEELLTREGSEFGKLWENQQV